LRSGYRQVKRVLLLALLDGENVGWCCNGNILRNIDLPPKNRLPTVT